MREKGANANWLNLRNLLCTDAIAPRFLMDCVNITLALVTKVGFTNLKNELVTVA
jgi:hypothetical protein